ncbi:MAG TPA: hypothetical protein VF638_00955 [Sphingomonas sp.]
MTKPHLAPVTTIYEKNASDVPAMLRKAADSIEAETDDDDRTKAMMAVQVSHGGAIAIYGWGPVDRFMAIGVLQAAITKLADNVEEHEA